MKCVQVADKSVVRVTDNQAHSMVRNGTGEYVPRKLWKEKTRDKDKVSADE